MFRVGDIITGKDAPRQGTYYTITTNEAIMKVLEVNGDQILALVLSHSGQYAHQSGLSFWVNAKHFRMVKPHIFDNREVVA
jgi:metal-dependent hydrolase (beta-lactamase superfamily II)